jgi:general secretion pathway protein C
VEKAPREYRFALTTEEYIQPMNAVSWNLPPSDRWREVMAAHGPRIATWVLALALGVQAALIVTDLTGGKTRPAATQVPVQPAQTARLNVPDIANGCVFGCPKVQEQTAQDARPTNIPLVLTGVIAVEDPRNGLAIIGENPQAGKVYAVGDSVPGGVKLHSVYNDRVILDRNGTLESLALPRQNNGSLPTAPPSAAAVLPTENPIAERMRQLVSSEPGIISDIMRPQPVFAQGKQRGYRVYPGRNRQAFVRLGLRPGDLVTAINGTPLDDPSRGQEIFATIGTSSEAHVTVVRNGQAKDVTLNMAQVAQDAEQMIGTSPAEGGALNPPEPADAPPPGAPRED